MKANMLKDGVWGDSCVPAGSLVEVRRHRELAGLYEIRVGDQWPGYLVFPQDVELIDDKAMIPYHILLKWSDDLLMVQKHLEDERHQNNAIEVERIRMCMVKRIPPDVQHELKKEG